MKRATTKPQIRTGRLKSWYFEEAYGRLNARLYGDPRFEDGERIRSSAIQKAVVDIYHSTIIVETRNSIYKVYLEDYGPADPTHQ